MRYPEEVVQEVLAMNDIVQVISGYVVLNQRSGNHVGLCPFHNEKSASFSVRQSEQFFYCFGCNVGGSVLTFIMKIENLDFVGALKVLADRVGYRLPEKEETVSAKQQRAAREISAELNKQAARFYFDYLYSDATDAVFARKYLEERGVHPTLAKKFGLGLSPSMWDGLIKHMSEVSPEKLVAAGLATQNRTDATKHYDRFRSRLMFPIIDPRNRVVGFGGRVMGGNDEAKYINTPETSLFHKSDNLYGLNLARKARTSELIVVEGYMDVLAMHQWGFTNAVGVLGTALNDSHVRLMKNAGCTSVVLIMDGDDAGIRATLRAIPALTKGGIKIKVLNISEQTSKEYSKAPKDPDEYLQLHGAAPLAAAIKNAKSHVAFQVKLEMDKFDLSTTDGRVGFTTEAAKLLATLPSAIETEAYVAEISKISDISPGAIFTEIDKQRGVVSTALQTTRRHMAQTSRTTHGIKKAREALLHLVLTQHTAAAALEHSGYIGAAELGGGLYAELLALAFANAAQDKQMSRTDIMSHFDSAEEHRSIVEIFIDQPMQHDKIAIEKTLNEAAFTIKRAWAISEMSNTENDQQALQALGLLARSKPQISI